MIIHIEKKVMGSLSHNMGDGVLAYTQGVSPAAGNLGSLLGENARADSASLYMFTHPQTRLLTVAHVQGAFTSLPVMAASIPLEPSMRLTQHSSATTGVHYPPSSIRSMAYGSTTQQSLDVRPTFLPPTTSSRPLTTRKFDCYSISFFAWYTDDKCSSD